MMTNELLTVSAPPHIRDEVTTSRIMITVLIALVPSILGALFFYGQRVILIILISVASALATEFLMRKAMNVAFSLNDGSAMVSGVLLALTLPPSVPLWLPAVGSFFAIAIGKQVFGGFGYNIFNPALLGRAFLLLSWPDLLKWQGPLYLWKEATSRLIQEKEVLTQLSSSHFLFSLFLGNVGNFLGDTSPVLVLVGAIYLLSKNFLKWRIPFAYILSFVLLTWMVEDSCLFHLLTGGIIFSAFFMATDPVTTPMTHQGQILFGVGVGVLSFFFRFKSVYQDGFTFPILLMNAVTPLIGKFELWRRRSQSASFQGSSLNSA